MIVNICSNIENQGGLQRDYEILREDLEALGHTVVGTQFEKVTDDARWVPRSLEKWTYQFAHFDVNLFLEIIVPSVFGFAKQNWFIPNCDYYYPGLWDKFIPRLDRVLVKTDDAFELWRDKRPHRLEHIGFRSVDLRQALPRTKAFFHAPGQSLHKGTDAVIEAWNRFNIEHPLTILTPHIHLRLAVNGNPMISAHDKVDEKIHRSMANLYRFHLCPSRYEGWGHTIHEALGVGAVVLSALPLPGTHRDCQIPSSVGESYNLITLRKIMPEDVRDTVEKAWRLSDAECHEISLGARAQFEHESNRFRSRLKEVFGCA